VSNTREIDELQMAVGVLAEFIGDAQLATTVSELEHAVEGHSRGDLQPILNASGISPALVRGALLVRQRIGRLSDVIHAGAILLALAEILEPGETLKRPSLAAGNDPTRPFDVESDVRIAEFKLSQWQGRDAARKRQTFKDLVHLAADESGRKAQLYVLGERPIRFLRTSRSSAAWGLDRFPQTQSVFKEHHFGPLSTEIRDFTAGPGQRAEIIDLEVVLTKVFQCRGEASSIGLDEAVDRRVS